jgi:hypothetical protein
MTDRKEHRLEYVAAVLLFLLLISPFLYFGYTRLPIHYYRHFDRIQARLEKLPDTKITDKWLHEDITLEDFGFTLQVRQCEPIKLDFYEGEEKNWYRYFDSMDGITFHKPYNPATNDYETTHISREELARAGIHVNNLADIVAHLEAVLDYLKNRPDQSPEKQHSGAHYLHIFYDLDAYKQTRAEISPKQ